MEYYIGIDLGGTNIKAGLVDYAERRIVASASVPTNAPRAAEAVAVDIVKLAERVASEGGVRFADIGWIGIATPGIVKNGTVLQASNLGWVNVPFAMLIERMSGHEVYLANDANAAAYAEALWGVGYGKSTLAMLTLGTGVGGGIVINGRIWEGFNGFAAEMGHMIIDMGGRECS